MKISRIPLSVKAIWNHLTPRISALHFQEDGSLLCGAFLGLPALWKIQPTRKGGEAHDIQEIPLDSALEGAEHLGVINGLRPSIKGDTAFAVLHDGGMPQFLRGLKSKRWDKINDSDLWDFLFAQYNSGSLVKHSILQIHEGRLNTRHLKHPGALIDVALIGDFIFGLSGKTFFREPLLNADKRYFLREDLLGNAALHKEEGGHFWFIGKDKRVVRVGLTDNKGVLTVKRLSGAPFLFSSYSSVDGWLYGASSGGKDFFRLRKNPESNEEELQLIKEFSAEEKISALFAVNQEKKACVLIATESEQGARLYSYPIEAPEDPEDIPELQDLEELKVDLENTKAIDQFTGEVPDKGKIRIWAGAREKDKNLSILFLEGIV